MKYSNLTVSIDPANENEIHYSFVTRHASVMAQTEADAARCIDELKARGVLREVADDELTDDEVIDAFDRAADIWLTEETHENALRLVRLYTGNENLQADKVSMATMSGFIMGMNAGKMIAERARKA
jgi:hypothetical protein